MLNIINSLKPFFEDCYRRINVREYAKTADISPPTASKILSQYNKEDLLKKEIYRNFIFYYANKESRTFIDLSRIYWRNKLNDLIENIKKETVSSTIILYGSLSKGEVKEDSDIDIAVILDKKKDILQNRDSFEKKLKRNIHLMVFETMKNIENKDLLNNILNGCILHGRVKF